MGRRNKKFYGVRVGREGAKVYNSWPECEAAVSAELCQSSLIKNNFDQVSGFSRACFAGFMTLKEAEDWVNEWLSINEPPLLPLPSNIANSVHSSTAPSEMDFIPFPVSPSTPSDDSVEIIVDPPAANATDDISKGLPLSVQQTDVLERVKRGESVFFTGSAGTGKSVLLKAIINELGGLGSPGLAITASTGIAAVNIGGTTLHSFAGVGLGKGTFKSLLEKVKASRYSRQRWYTATTLIIDEISMIDGRFFDVLEAIARSVRKTDEPFGGIQLVLSGDFCQLPPVPDQLGGTSLPIKFAFEAESWKRCVSVPVVLQKVFRQKDQEFVRILNCMRYGNIKREDEERFIALSRPIIYEDGIEATELFPLRYEVQQANISRLAGLSGPEHTYVAHDVPGTDNYGRPVPMQHAEKLLERLVAVKEVTLKIGAQVMLIKNLVQGELINGSLGNVVAFKTVGEAIRDGNKIGIPDSSGNDNYDTKPVSIKLSLESMDDPSKDTSMDIKRRVWPVVHFTTRREVLCVPVSFDVVNARGEFEAKRDQVPLILSWAMSVHKSQGQTLQRVKVDLARTFEKGQAYVALSRATDMETLQVLHFNKNKVMVHPRVLEWHAAVTKQIQEEEEWAILQEMHSEEALQAFFKDDTDDEF